MPIIFNGVKGQCVKTVCASQSLIFKDGMLCRMGLLSCIQFSGSE